MESFEAEMKDMDRSRRSEFRSEFKDIEKALRVLLGPEPGRRIPVLLRQQYGQTRWDRALIKLDEVLFVEEWDYSNADEMGVKAIDIPIPEAMKDEVAKYREALLEAVSDFDDDIAEKYLAGENVTVDEFKLGIRKATVSLEFVGVIPGSAFKKKGVQEHGLELARRHEIHATQMETT